MSVCRDPGGHVQYYIDASKRFLQCRTLAKRHRAVDARNASFDRYPGRDAAAGVERGGVL